MKKPSRAIIMSVSQRLIDIGIDADLIPLSALGQLARGKILLIVHKLDAKCPCCGKPIVRAMGWKKTERPLKELFK